MNKNLAKKIVSITIIAIVVALVITTIILALVPKKMADPIASGYASITVYQDSTANQYIYTASPTTDAQRKHNEVYKEIERLHEESLKDNILSAIFQGTGSFKASVKRENKTNAINSIAAQAGNALVYRYLSNEPQVLKINGEVYKDESTLSSQTVTYDMIIMPLGTGTNFEECTIYLVDTEKNASSYQVTFLACQAELNDYISSLDFGLAS